MSSKELRIRYTGDITGLKTALSGIDDAHASLGDKLRLTGQQISNVGKSMTVGLTLPIVAFGTAAVKAFADADKVFAQTEAVIASTGGAANVTAAEVGALALKVSMYSGLSDEAVASGENLLLTFTNIRNEVGAGNDVFDQATATIADMSVALGQDLNSSAIQLGKALNDPIKGVTALQRVGVSFTEAQREQIAAMVETGDVMGAQKLILAELAKEFGGSAKAAGETAAGQWNIAKEQIGNAMESIGRVIVDVGVPIFEKLSGALQGALDWFNELDPGMQNIIVTLGAVVAALGPLVFVIGKLVSAFGAVVGAVKAVTLAMAANPFVAITIAVVALTALIIANWDTIKEFLLNVWSRIKEIATNVWDSIKGALETVWNAIKTAAQTVWQAIKTVIVTPIEKLIEIYATIWGTIFDALGVVWGGIKTAAGVVWNTIKAVIIDPIREAKDIVLDVFRTVKEVLGDIWNGIKGVAVAAWNGITAAIKAALNLAIDGINVFIRGVNAASGALDWLAGPFANWQDIPSIPHLAHGGRILAPGLAVVGERGPELVGLPRGAQVAPLGGAVGGGGAMTVNINVGTLLGSNQRELARIIRDELLKLQARNVTASIA